ncbi:apolipoprotein N-acyltransferase [Streptacidiphilus sp. EB129]|uniref:apolipoprotein N-acyltransferase n=1 Tax=Streptacidiphilus sp. EB129 TaxID=3156262 RepID=UPI003510D6FE
MAVPVDPSTAPTSGPVADQAAAEAVVDVPATVPSRWSRIRRTVRAGLPRTGLAVVCGLLFALSFPSYGVWPLSLVAVAGVSLLTYRRSAREAAWTGFAFAAPFLLWLLVWLNVIGVDAWVLLSLFEALFVAAMAAGLATVSRLPGWPLWTACLWVAQEWARDRVPLGGFPWGRLAFANTSSPFTPLAALGGAALVSFAVALGGALLAAAVVQVVEHRTARRRALERVEPEPAGPAGSEQAEARREAVALAGSGRWRIRAAASVALAAVVGLVGFAVPIPTAGTTAGGPASVEVALIQGNVPHAGMDFLGRPMQVLQNHVQATLKLAQDIAAGRAAKPDLVIWPENSSDVNPYTTPEAYAAIQGAVDTIGVPVLVGALVDGPDAQHVQNEGIVWMPSSSAAPGPGAHYTKQHPVPFGEYVPFRSVLSKYITRLQRVARDFAPGKQTGILQLGPARIGDVICFEVAYDGIVRDAVTQGGRVLVVQTNNATYEHSDQPDQQFAMSRLRAVEHGRSVLIAATSGISAVIAPDGSVTTRSQLATAAELEARVPLRDPLTVADRVGAAPEWFLSVVGLLACGAAVVIARRRRV